MEDSPTSRDTFRTDSIEEENLKDKFDCEIVNQSKKLVTASPRYWKLKSHQVFFLQKFAFLRYYVWNKFRQTSKNLLFLVFHGFLRLSLYAFARNPVPITIKIYNLEV